MMRSLWTAASGMKGQQTNVDTIANNLANVNTTGYKTQTTQFKTLLYQTLQEETTTATGDVKQTTAQVGLGTRVASINSIYTQGIQTASDNKSALYINGQGFFAVRGADNKTYYTRNGDFGWSLDANGRRVLTNSDGLEVLDNGGNPILLPDEAGTDAVTFGTDGAVAYRRPDGTYTQTGQSVALYQFANPVGLEKNGSNLLSVSNNSGQPRNEANTNGLIRSTIAQGYIEGSNVNVADEMVNMIIAQRAYEMNSKAITTSDSMLDTANNLKR